MRLALVGYGHMGRAVEEEALADGHQVCARLGRAELTEGVGSLSRALRCADVAIHFSVGEQVADTVLAAQEANVDLVIGTTDLDDRALEALNDVSGIGVVHGPNFSIGVHVFFQLVRKAARLAEAAGTYDVFLHEMHHRHKRDHPSGTAVRAADITVEEMESKDSWVRGPPEGPADPKRLYVSSVRAGEIPGSHLVGLEGRYDRLEVRHEARSRRGFAQGAIRAAEWIKGRGGVFDFAEVVADLLGTSDQRGEA